jgi:hypothetical protein
MACHFKTHRLLTHFRENIALIVDKVLIKIGHRKNMNIFESALIKISIIY